MRTKHETQNSTGPSGGKGQKHLQTDQETSGLRFRAKKQLGLTTLPVVMSRRTVLKVVELEHDIASAESSSLTTVDITHRHHRHRHLLLTSTTVIATIRTISIKYDFSNAIIIRMISTFGIVGNPPWKGSTIEPLPQPF